METPEVGWQPAVCQSMVCCDFAACRACEHTLASSHPLFEVLQAGLQPDQCMQHFGEHLHQRDLLHSKQDLTRAEITALQPATLSSTEMLLEAP